LKETIVTGEINNMELPIQFKERMIKLLGEEEFSQYEESFYAKRTYGLRVNTNKISTEEFEKISPFKLKKVPWISNGYFYDGDNNSPAKHPYYHAGLYYLQEPSAMTPAELLLVKEGDYVLDLCAAPGGKATELAAKLKGSGLLVANDISNSRAKGLLKNLELFGVSNMMVTNETPDRLLEVFENFFDKILIDAPCSGEGMFRKDPAIMKSWVKKGPEEFAKIQREIVTTAVRMLKPGGMLLYSTCTFAPEEDEGTISYLLDNFDDMEIVDLPLFEGFCSGRPQWLSESFTKYDSLTKAIRLFPHKMDCEGHFICLLRKKGDNTVSEFNVNKYKKIDNGDFFDFLSNVNKKFDTDRFVMYSDRIYMVPPGYERAKGLHFLRNGLLFGECKKNRFEPSQALAMNLTKSDYRNTIDLLLDDARVIKYLKGETIEVDDLTNYNDNGWYLVCVDGFTLGWGKLTSGTLKNKYHSGWRWM